MLSCGLCRLLKLAESKPLVHAISEDAKRFYERNGFSVSPVDPMTLMITVADAKKSAIWKMNRRASTDLISASNEEASATQNRRSEP